MTKIPSNSSSNNANTSIQMPQLISSCHEINNKIEDYFIINNSDKLQHIKSLFFSLREDKLSAEKFYCANNPLSFNVIKRELTKSVGFYYDQLSDNIFQYLTEVGNISNIEAINFRKFSPIFSQPHPFNLTNKKYSLAVSASNLQYNHYLLTLDSPQSNLSYQSKANHTNNDENNLETIFTWENMRLRCDDIINQIQSSRTNSSALINMESIVTNIYQTYELLHEFCHSKICINLIEIKREIKKEISLKTDILSENIFANLSLLSKDFSILNIELKDLTGLSKLITYDNIHIINNQKFNLALEIALLQTNYNNLIKEVDFSDLKFISDLKNEVILENGSKEDSEENTPADTLANNSLSSSPTQQLYLNSQLNKSKNVNIPFNYDEDNIAMLSSSDYPLSPLRQERYDDNEEIINNFAGLRRPSINSRMFNNKGSSFSSDGSFSFVESEKANTDPFNSFEYDIFQRRNSTTGSISLVVDYPETTDYTSHLIRNQHVANVKSVHPIRELIREEEDNPALLGTSEENI